MSLKRAEPGWSLTRRMAVAFAITTSSIVLLYGAGSTYLVFDKMRDDLNDFMEHELDELSHNLQATDGAPASIEVELGRILSIDGEAPCAFRVRAADGSLIAEDGRPRLLRRVTAPIQSRESWRHLLFSDNVAIHATKAEVPPGATLEIIVDARAAVSELWRYMGTSGLAFLLSVVLAGLAGYLVARRGLHSLRDVVDQARSIEMPAGRNAIRLDDAPVEVRDVGRALNSMLDRIDDGLKEMRTFTAGLAHELRSPLQNLIGETEVMLLSERTVDDYRSLLTSNLEDLHELSDCVDNLVTYCRGSNPADRERTRETFDLADEARIRIDRLRRVAAASGVEVCLSVNGDTTLEADREACLRLVRNLVANAVEWSPTGGRVDVTMTGLETSVRIEVADQGPGIPAKLRHRMYEPFVSGRTSQGRRAGYGLGLAICRAVVDEHRGSLRHEPVATGGTRFVAELPRDSRADSTTHGERITRWSRRHVATG